MAIRNFVILTGAGVSPESGVPTFRGPDGLWEGHRVEDVATPQAFARDPALVQKFYDARRAALATVSPNAAYPALARLDAEWPKEAGRDLLLVTQNVDDLQRGRPASAASNLQRSSRKTVRPSDFRNFLNLL
jgi:NAD-dependent deacetylase